MDGISDSPPDEVWKPVPGLPLEASSFGRIRKTSGGWRKGMILKGGLDKFGYRIQKFREGQKGGVLYLKHHRLVCLAFHGLQPKGKKLALHKNGIKSDNRPENLYWGDTSDNMRDYHLQGGAQAKVPVEVGLEIRRRAEEMRKVPGRKRLPNHALSELAAGFGLTWTNVNHVLYRYKHLDRVDP